MPLWTARRAATLASGVLPLSFLARPCFWISARISAGVIGVRLPSSTWIAAHTTEPSRGRLVVVFVSLGLLVALMASSLIDRVRTTTASVGDDLNVRWATTSDG
jgi:hypothetical protein